MILLLGGTSETAIIAEALAADGYRVLVSLATDVPLATGQAPGLTVRRGRLGLEEMVELLTENKVRLVVDAAHPFATALHEVIGRACVQAKLPLVRWERAGLEEAEQHHGSYGSYGSYGSHGSHGSHDPASCLIRVADHATAAQVAADYARQHGGTIALTTGSRVLRPYVEAARAAGVPVVARVLEAEESLQACAAAGLADSAVVTARGPFSLEENRRFLRQNGAAVLVTKDSGETGGVPEKIAAAREENVLVIVVERPTPASSAEFAESTSDLGTLREFVARALREVPLFALDVESVLWPEIWPALGEEFGVTAWQTTTREEQDLTSLMRRRLTLARERNISAAQLQRAAAKLAPLPHAVTTLEQLSALGQVVLLTDACLELLTPVVTAFAHPALLGHHWQENAAGFPAEWLAGFPGKAALVQRWRAQGRKVLAVGDSWNDLAMLRSADAGFWVEPSPALPPEVRSAFPLVARENLAETLSAAAARLFL